MSMNRKRPIRIPPKYRIPSALILKVIERLWNLPDIERPPCVNDRIKQECKFELERKR